MVQADLNILKLLVYIRVSWYAITVPCSAQDAVSASYKAALIWTASLVLMQSSALAQASFCKDLAEVLLREIQHSSRHAVAKHHLPHHQGISDFIILEYRRQSPHMRRNKCFIFHLSRLRLQGWSLLCHHNESSSRIYHFGAEMSSS